MKKLLFSLCAFTILLSTQAQTEEELKALQGPKKDSIAAIQARIDALQAKIDALPGWKFGAFGTIGGSISRFNNWYGQVTPNISSGSIGFTFNTFANLKQEKYFWNNSLNVNLGWLKIDNRDDDLDVNEFAPVTDIFQLTSLYGYKLNDKLAISALGEYRTALLDGQFNNPGYLDIGAGATWTPVENLVVVVHPLNYNIVFTKTEDIYESSLGTKVVADYTRTIGAIGFKSNFTGFFSYNSSDLNNYTWTNSLSYKLWKVIGVGFDFGLRGSKQETLDYLSGLEDADENLSLETIDGDLQSFWILGLSYSF